MPTIEGNDEQILHCLDQLSPAGRRAALQKLIGSLERLDCLVERNRSKLESVCQARNIDFSRLTEDERETLMDEILNEHATS